MIALLVSAALALDCQLYPTDSCVTEPSVSTVLDPSAGTAVSAVDMGGLFKRLDVYARVCGAVGPALHLADSPTNTGVGYDDGTADHDSELWLVDDVVGFTSAGAQRGGPVFSSMRWPGLLDPARTDADGCHVVRMGFVEAASRRDPAFVEVDPDVDDVAGIPSSLRVQVVHGPRLDYTACANAVSSLRGFECDYEDAALADVQRWYVGVNRLVGDSTTGAGVEEACLVMSINRRRAPPSCLAE